MADRGPSSLVPVLVLAALFAVMAAGWWVFPRFQEYRAHEDCIATGRTNC